MILHNVRLRNRGGEIFLGQFVDAALGAGLGTYVSELLLWSEKDKFKSLATQLREQGSVLTNKPKRIHLTLKDGHVVIDTASAVPADREAVAKLQALITNAMLQALPVVD